MIKHLNACACIFSGSHKVVIECFECEWEVLEANKTGQDVCGPSFKHNQAETKICNGYCKVRLAPMESGQLHPQSYSQAESEYRQLPPLFSAE